MRIKEAIRQVPFVAYAQGVLAIGTLMFFLVAKFRSVPQAVVGVVAMLLLMILLGAVVPPTPGASAFGGKAPRQVLTWFVVVLVVVGVPVGLIAEFGPEIQAVGTTLRVFFGEPSSSPIVADFLGMADAANTEITNVGPKSDCPKGTIGQLDPDTKAFTLARVLIPTSGMYRVDVKGKKDLVDEIEITGSPPQTQHGFRGTGVGWLPGAPTLRFDPGPVEIGLWSYGRKATRAEQPLPCVSQLRLTRAE